MRYCIIDIKRRNRHYKYKIRFSKTSKNGRIYLFLLFYFRLQGYIYIFIADINHLLYNIQYCVENKDFKAVIEVLQFCIFRENDLYVSLKET